MDLRIRRIQTPCAYLITSSSYHISQSIGQCISHRSRSQSTAIHQHSSDHTLPATQHQHYTHDHDHSTVQYTARTGFRVAWYLHLHDFTECDECIKQLRIDHSILESTDIQNRLFIVCTTFVGHLQPTNNDTTKASHQCLASMPGHARLRPFKHCVIDDVRIIDDRSKRYHSPIQQRCKRHRSSSEI